MESDEDAAGDAIAYQPSRMKRGMVNVTGTVKASGLERTASLTALGDLGLLPLELLYEVVRSLDLRSLARTARTCVAGATLVWSLREWRDLIRCAPDTLLALGRTQSAQKHNAIAFHAALIASRCVSCGHFGPFLHLPKCWRCCYYCLWKNQALWAIPPSVARKAFGLDTLQMKHLPCIRSIPGEYFVGYIVTLRRPMKLVSVHSAKLLALAMGRSEADLLQDLVTRRSTQNMSLKEYHTLRHAIEAEPAPPGAEIHLRLSESNVPNDRYCGMTSILFPHLTIETGLIERGSWCRGCEHFYWEWYPNGPIPAPGPYASSQPPSLGGGLERAMDRPESVRIAGTHSAVPRIERAVAEKDHLMTVPSLRLEWRTLSFVVVALANTLHNPSKLVWRFRDEKP